MSARSRIAILHQGFIPAYRVRFYELLNDRSPHEYVVFHGAPPRGSGHLELTGPFGFPNVRIRNRQLQIDGRMLIYQPVIRKILTEQFDAIVVGHEFKFLTSMLLFGLFKLKGKPAVLWGHGYHRPDAAWLARRGSLLLARAADAYLAYTDRGASQLQEAGIAADRITVVCNTLDMDSAVAAHRLFIATDRDRLKAELNLRPEAKTLLYIGRLYARKRVGDLIELARRLNADAGVAPVDLLIVGDGPDRPQLEAQAVGVPSVRFLGNVYDPIEVAKLMRIAVASLVPGSAGLAINHSFAHGVPVITRPNELNSPEVDYIRHGNNGLVVAGDFDAYVAAVASFLRDEQMQARMAAAALTTRERLSLDNMVAQFDHGVSQAIEQRQRPPLRGEQLVRHRDPASTGSEVADEPPHKRNTAG